jgi:hypothetical protein
MTSDSQKEWALVSKVTSESREDIDNEPEVERDAHVASLLGGYALGALDPDETELVARHIQSCPTCRAELDAYEQAAGLLPYASPVRPVPVRARAALLGRLDRIGTTNPERLIVIRPPAKQGPLRRWWQRRPALQRVAAFSAVPLALVLGVVMIMANIINDQQQELSQMQAEQGDGIELMAKADKPSAQATFIPSGSASQTRGKLLVDRTTNEAMILAVGLPQLDESQQYVAWLQIKGTNEYARVAVLETDDAGRAQHIIEPVDSIDNYDMVIVTVESNPEVYMPTGPEVMSAAVTPER